MGRVWQVFELLERACWLDNYTFVLASEIVLIDSKEIKVLFSSSIDGMIIAWSSNGKPIQKIQVNSPVYCLAYNSRRAQLMAGQNRKVRLFQLIGDDNAHGAGVGSDILEKKTVVCCEHFDIVNCLVSCEGRFYSAG